jgi:acetamidase/formamidase
VRIETSLSSSPEDLQRAGVPPDQIPQSLRDIFREVTNKGPGPHILTGPIFVEGAEPGDTLEIHILSVGLAIPYGYNEFVPGYGFLPDEFPYARTRIIPLDRERGVARFSPNITLPVHPFFGSMGVAPPLASGRVSSMPPWIQGGNMDNRELVAGATLYLPVHAPGALFSIGDGHAMQGNGEVTVTALETSLEGTLQFVVRKDLKILYPRAETRTHYISMGFHTDLKEATRLAVLGMIDFLVREKHLSRDDAYMLISMAGDVDDTQLVDGNLGVHVLVPKSIFSASSSATTH